MIIGGEYDDSRNALTHWYPTVEQADGVPLLQAFTFDISDVKPTFSVMNEGIEAFVRNLQEIPTAEINKVVSELPEEKAHIRTEFKSAQIFAEEEDGWVITSEPKDIDEQVLHLVDAITMYELSYSTLVVREWIPIDTIENPVTGESESIEVRCIVDDGEAIDWFTDIRDSEFTREQQEELDTQIADEASMIMDISEQAVEQLETDSWSVDFIRTTEGNWYLTDMALYGLYRNERLDEWVEYSHTPPYQPSSILTNRLDEIPDEIVAEVK